MKAKFFSLLQQILYTGGDDKQNFVTMTENLSKQNIRSTHNVFTDLSRSKVEDPLEQLKEGPF